MSGNTKAQFSFAIELGETPLNEMLNRIDMYHIEGKLTDEERQMLYDEATAQAVDHFADQLNVSETIVSLDRRINALEDAVTAINARLGEDENNEEETVQDFIDGRWYYNGDRVSFNGVIYTCSAPDGFPVVWSPATTPQYWIADGS